MRQMRHAKPHSKAVSYLRRRALTWSRLDSGKVTARDRINYVYAGVAKSYCAMREYGQISAKTLGEMRKNTHEGVQPKNFK